MSGQGGSPKDPNDDKVYVTKRWKTGMIIAVVVLTLVVVGLLAYIFFGHHIKPVINQHLGKQINAAQKKWQDVTGVTALKAQQAETAKAAQLGQKTAEDLRRQYEQTLAQQAAQSQQRISALEAQTPAFLAQRRQQLQQRADELSKQLEAQQAAIRAQQAQDAAAKAALAQDLQEQAAQQQAALAAATGQDNRGFLQRWNPWG